jgi:putative ATP-dependent endonuclease of OLD family
VEATVAALTRLHPRVCALVDGDPTGIGYARALVAAAERPAVVLRWPDGWSIEDTIGWILDANSSRVLAALTAPLAPAPASVAALVARLKSDDRAGGGLKQDQIAYEAVADVIGEIEECQRRARELLNAMTDLLLGRDNARFAAAPGGDPAIRIFQP